MSDENMSENPNVNAENHSIAVGGIQIGGNVENLAIGHTTVYQYATEEDVPLTSEEIELGLSRLAEYLPERAPILQERFNSEAKKLRATLGVDSNSLSPILKTQREDGVNHMKLMCMEALDISFRALCQGKNPPPYDSRPPFLGLFAFRPEDREFFFGREALVQKLVARIKRHPFLAVMGASGSGKSSLVMAGLIPALEAEMTYFTPSSVPLYQLKMAKDKSNHNTVFVVDQFEEIFTLTQDALEREEFFSELLSLAKTKRVIITMRADFWGEVAAYKDLKQAMQEHQELIAPMDADELHQAVQKQAGTVGLRFDPTLSETILEEVKSEPGAMPLLQHALWMLWKRRHGLWLKADEYKSFGGIQQAITTTADEIYKAYSPEDRERMRNVFVRLTRLDETGKASRDTRRRVKLKDLIYKNDTLAQTAGFVHGLANSRLLTTSSESLDEDEVEVSHEALIRNWPRLRNWLNEDRLSLLVQEEVREAASNWEVSDQDIDTIEHRGGKLEDALHLAGNPRSTMSSIEIQYLEACKKLEMGFGKNIISLLTQFAFSVAFPGLVLIAGITLAILSVEYVPLGYLISIVAPLYTFFFIYKQDKYRIVEIKWVAFCLFGGMAGYFIAAQVNPALIEYGIASRDMVIRLYGPIIETALKGVILYLLLSRVKLARTVDGIIYGVAVGAGFAIIENYEYIVGNPEIAIIIALARAFSTNLIHMPATGLSGYLLITARFDKNKLVRTFKILTALTLPSIINSLFNTMVSNGVNVSIAVAMGLMVLIALVAGIRYLINQDQKWVENFLQGGSTLNSTSPLNNVQQVANAIRNLFGKVRASQIERFLILQARRGILEKTLQNTDDPKIKHSIEEQMNTVKKKIRGTRGAVSNYCWENVKSFIPELTRLTEENDIGSAHVR